MIAAGAARIGGIVAACTAADSFRPDESRPLARSITVAASAA
jgi:hypothetical protein